MKETLKALLVTAGATTLAAAWRAHHHWSARGATATPHPQPVPTGESPVPTPQKRPRESIGLTAKKLLEVLTLTRPLIQKHPTLPILETVLLEPGTITATDLESRLTLTLPELTVPPVCVNAARLREVLRMLKGPLTVELDHDVLVLNGALRLATYPASEYPGAVLVPGNGWAGGPPFSVPLRLGDVLPAMARDESRPQLHGVCFDLANGAVVASDGHRLHMVTGSRCTSGAKHIISAIAARTLAQFAVHGAQGQVFTRDEQRGAGEIEHLVDMVFVAPGVTLRTHTVAVEFPDYLQVLPSAHARYAVTCDTQPLVDALKQAMAVGPKNTMCSVSLTCVEGGVRVRLESLGEGSCCVVVPGSGWHLKRYVGVQAPYLLDLIQCAGGPAVTLSIADANRPLLVRAEEFTGVVMPVGIDTCPEDMEDEPATVPVDVARAEDRPSAA